MNKIDTGFFWITAGFWLAMWFDVAADPKRQADKLAFWQRTWIR